VRRQREEDQRRRAEAERQQFHTEKEILVPLEMICKSLTALLLQAAGYHQHDRGEWRKRMRKTKQITKGEKKEINRLFEEARAGDHAALAELKRFEGVPGEYAMQIMRQQAGAGQRAERALIYAIAQEDTVAQETLRREANELRNTLSASASSPLERLLIDRIACCWLHVNFAQAWCTAGEFMRVGERTEDYLEKRLNFSHRRFLQAVKTLAQVRRLLGPSIQLNVAEKQINILDTHDRKG